MVISAAVVAVLYFLNIIFFLRNIFHTDLCGEWNMWKWFIFVFFIHLHRMFYARNNVSILQHALLSFSLISVTPLIIFFKFI